ncbi:MAG TPA: DUF4282 domain-containing protein [Buttiauxella sp.]|jgi:c-di-AMP phosphodiesterase-like protein
MKLLSFEEMITPKILTSLYSLTTLLGIVFAVIGLFTGFLKSSIILIIAVVFNRVFFEFIIVTFKNNEYLKDNNDYLKRIAEALEGCEKNHAGSINTREDIGVSPLSERSQDKQ